MKTTTTKTMKTMKKMLISLFALLLLAVQAQAQKQPLAVLVVGVDSWMFGDVIAHIVGEELKRSNPNLVPVTREKFVQNKLKELRRATGEINLCELRDWASAQGLTQVCLVEAKEGVGGNANVLFSFANAEQKYSAQVIDVAGNVRSCVAAFDFKRSGGGEMAAAELTKVAWEVVGRLQSSSCQTAERIKCYSFEPEMVFVQGGTFQMGCLQNRDGSCSATGTNAAIHLPLPVHVKVKDFWIGKYEVTQAEWGSVMGTVEGITFSDSYGKGPHHPAYKISYHDALLFISNLNQRTGKNYRLPTEAEWEYAARGGSAPEKKCAGGCAYSGSNTGWHVTWYSGNAGGKGHGVGTRKTYNADSENYTGGGTSSPIDGGGNELGIYDMNGNVYEWCADNLQKSLPKNSSNSQSNPYVWDKPYNYDGNDDIISRRVVRGGSRIHSIGDCRTVYRNGYTPYSRYEDQGFRVVLP
ncbi:MAG: formylglycine-generating enzyme family protein [Prevotellaceae bacterium]|jgi:formylglycine-generating enzyme required for sulfatase activity|nr:formylglycine-generating enzyme family protein [Prevotellaceae bacterium]